MPNFHADWVHAPRDEWAVSITHRTGPPGPGCQPAVIEHRATDRIRGACWGCDWTGPEYPKHPPSEDSEARATEDAHDHAFPGWRELPLLRDRARNYDNPHTQKLADEKLARELAKIYPPGFIRAGAPIRTRRAKYGTRHVPEYSPWGGYDMCGAVDDDPEPPPKPDQASLL